MGEQNALVRSVQLVMLLCALTVLPFQFRLTKTVLVFNFYFFCILD